MCANRQTAQRAAGFTSAGPLQVPGVPRHAPTLRVAYLAMLVIAGAAITLKIPALVAVPPGVMIAIGPLAAPAGTTAVILLPLLLIVNVALVPANVTLVVPLRFWPLIVTDAPAPPLWGEKLVIVGTALPRTE